MRLKTLICSAQSQSIALVSIGQMPLSQFSDLSSTNSAVVKPSLFRPRLFCLNIEIKIIFVEQGRSTIDYGSEKKCIRQQEPASRSHDNGVRPVDKLEGHEKTKRGGGRHRLSPSTHAISPPEPRDGTEEEEA
jgi:hypothetical protein